MIEATELARLEEKVSVIRRGLNLIPIKIMQVEWEPILM